MSCSGRRSKMSMRRVPSRLRVAGPLFRLHLLEVVEEHRAWVAHPR